MAAREAAPCGAGERGAAEAAPLLKASTEETLGSLCCWSLCCNLVVVAKSLLCRKPGGIRASVYASLVLFPSDAYRGVFWFVCWWLFWGLY